MNARATPPQITADELDDVPEASVALDLLRNTPVRRCRGEKWTCFRSGVEPSPGRVRSLNRCPACHSIIYSRSHRLCGVCAHPLPVEFMFSVAETVRIQRLMDEERQRHRQWLAKLSG